MLQAARIDVYSHGVKLSRYSRQFLSSLYGFCHDVGLVQYVLVSDRRGKRSQKMSKVFAASPEDRSEMRFHRFQLPELLKYLKQKGYTEDRLNIVYHPAPDGVPIHLELADPTRLPREHQLPWIEYQNSEGQSKLNTLKVGMGKTYCALYTAMQLAERTAMVLSSRYVGNWTNAIAETFGRDVQVNDTMVVQGSGQLIKLIELAQAGKLDCKFIIISINTLQNFLKSYEHDFCTTMPYGCEPEDLWKVLGVGFKIHDETHEMFHVVHKIDVYSNIKKCLYLSGTMVPDDQFLLRMYHVCFPKSVRFDLEVHNNHVDVTALMYGLTSRDKVKWKGYGGAYSHIAFEESIMKSKELTKSYYGFTNRIVTQYYTSQAEPGQKMLIFAATVEMCTQLTDYLRKLNPTYTINRYTAEDDFETLLESDITCTTIKSAGTGVDIPNLRVSYMSVALGSSQANEQVLGRTRPMKNWPDIAPEFIYGVCRDIDKHVNYHVKKLENFKGKVKSHRELETDFYL